jgi:hypothetical protein
VTRTFFGTTSEVVTVARGTFVPGAAFPQVRHRRRVNASPRCGEVGEQLAETGISLRRPRHTQSDFLHRALHVGGDDAEQRELRIVHQ